jgi:hypothetical protein
MMFLKNKTKTTARHEKLSRTAKKISDVSTSAPQRSRLEALGV